MNRSRRVVRQAGPPADFPKPVAPARRENGNAQQSVQVDDGAARSTGDERGARADVVGAYGAAKAARAAESSGSAAPENTARKRNRRGRRRRGGSAATAQPQANPTHASDAAASVTAASASAVPAPASAASGSGAAVGYARTSAGSNQPKRRRKRRRGGTPKLPTRPIVFVGPMAAGKTSLGRRVAKELGLQFVDSDVLFVRKHGPIAEFFTANGEPEFRRIEAEIIAAELATAGTRILALGGGAVLSDATRALLANHPTILLMTTQEAVLRTANVSRRPLLRDDPNSWGRILEARRPLYNEVADVTFRTDRAGKEQLTRRVVEWVHSYGRREHQQLQQLRQDVRPQPHAAERASEETLNEQE